MGCGFTPWQANSTLHMDLRHVPAAREKGWYLALMAPNTKGPHYAWLDPSRLYCHPQVHSDHTGGTEGVALGGLWGHPAPPYLSPQGLQDCVADLLQPFQGDPIDLVAGIDAMGFILGKGGCWGSPILVPMAGDSAIPRCRRGRHAA